MSNVCRWAAVQRSSDAVRGHVVRAGSVHVLRVQGDGGQLAWTDQHSVESSSHCSVDASTRTTTYRPRACTVDYRLLAYRVDLWLTHHTTPTIVCLSTEPNSSSVCELNAVNVLLLLLLLFTSGVKILRVKSKVKSKTKSWSCHSSSLEKLLWSKMELKDGVRPYYYHHHHRRHHRHHGHRGA